MIRPGGNGRIEVRYKPTGLSAFPSYYSGPWFWRVPYPKGHPSPPQWHEQFGRAPTQKLAIQRALHRARYLYGPWDVDIVITKQYRGSDVAQAFYAFVKINGEPMGRQLTVDHPECGYESSKQIETYFRGLAREFVLEPLNHLVTIRSINFQWQ